MIRISGMFCVIAAVAMFNATPSIATVTSCSVNKPCVLNGPFPSGNDFDADPNDETLRIWDEQQNYTLAEDLAVDFVADANADFLIESGGTTFIQAGTIVSSHWVQWDNSGGNQNFSFVEGEIGFDSDIFAFITDDARLDASDDVLGLPSVTYPDFEMRGLELGSQDTVAFGSDLSTVEIDWRAGSPGDWSRLLTAFSPTAADTVPVPGLGLLVALGAMVLLRRPR